MLSARLFHIGFVEVNYKKAALWYGMTFWVYRGKPYVVFSLYDFVVLVRGLSGVAPHINGH